MTPTRSFFGHKSAFIFSILLTASAAIAAELPNPKIQAQDVDYGEMYVLQKRETVKKPWSASLSYSYGFSNPYFATHGANINLTRNLSDFVFVGISPSFYATSDNDVPRLLTQNLGAQGIDTKLFRPETAAYAIVGISPLTGMLNWFSTKPVNFDFSIGAGVGGIRYSNFDSTFLSIKFFAMPQVMVSNNLGFMAGIQTSYDRFTTRNNEWENRVDVLGGVSTRF